MDENEFIDNVNSIAFAQSIKYEGENDLNYAYAFGYQTTVFKSTLNQLKLTEEQREVLGRIIAVYSSTSNA